MIDPFKLFLLKEESNLRSTNTSFAKANETTFHR